MKFKEFFKLWMKAYFVYIGIVTAITGAGLTIMYFIGKHMDAEEEATLESIENQDEPLEII